MNQHKKQKNNCSGMPQLTACVTLAKLITSESYSAEQKNETWLSKIICRLACAFLSPSLPPYFLPSIPDVHFNISPLCSIRGNTSISVFHYLLRGTPIIGCRYACLALLKFDLAKLWRVVSKVFKNGSMDKAQRKRSPDEDMSPQHRPEVPPFLHSGGEQHKLL